MRVMNGYDQAKKEYLRTKVLTASPAELQLMLYDGAIRFAEEAKDRLEKKEFEAAHDAMVRAQNIVLELSSSLKHDIDPDLCGKMSSLYNFIYRKLVEGNLKHQPQAIQEAIMLLNYQRETWVMLMAKLAEETQSARPATAAVSARPSRNRYTPPRRTIFTPPWG